MAEKIYEITPGTMDQIKDVVAQARKVMEENARLLAEFSKVRELNARLIGEIKELRQQLNGEQWEEIADVAGMEQDLGNPGGLVLASSELLQPQRNGSGPVVDH